MFKALLAEPHGDGEGAGSVMAKNDDGLVRIELLVGAAGDFTHGHEERVRKMGGLVLPGFANVQEDEREEGIGGLLAQFLKGFDRKFGFKGSLCHECKNK